MGRKNWTDILYLHAEFGGDRWHMAAGDEKQKWGVFFICFVCLCVTLDARRHVRTSNKV